MIPSFGRLATAVCALASTAAAVIPLEVSGTDFINSQTKQRFQIIGVDYQPGGSSGFTAQLDPLSNGAVCLRDAALMQRLGVNAIRVYNLDPTLNHDECASIFNAAGIYMILDVNTPFSTGSLNRAAPWTTYTNTYYEQVFGVIEAFKSFDNVLGFFAGNEVINQAATYSAPAYVRAVIRDMKEYIAQNSPRAIPVGYSAADVAPILVDTANYFMCDLSNSTASRADFFGLNSYSWCGAATYVSSGYNVLVEQFSNASLPVFFSEYGCNAVKPRIFTEVQALYGQQMSQVFSGGLVYEWTEESNQYGLVAINNTNTVTTLIDYDNLQKQLNKLNLQQIMSAKPSQTTVKPGQCNPSLISGSNFYNAWNLPTPPSNVPGWIKSGLPNAPSGSLVQVHTQTIPEKVYDYTGKLIPNVQFNVLAKFASNNPSGSSTSSSSSSSSTPSHKNAAPATSPSMVLGGLSGLFMLAASLF